MSEDGPGSFKDSQTPKPEGQSGPNGSGHGHDLDRLPPPAFPPGVRMGRGPRPRPSLDVRRAESAGGEEEGVPDDAFIWPDESIVGDSRIAPGAFISPDEPIPPRQPDDDDDVVVTGIGDDPHLGEEDLAFSRYSDPQVADLVLRLGRLAESLRDKGEAGLRTTPDMNRFEATLRAYCLGYLAAQRETRPE